MLHQVERGSGPPRWRAAIPFVLLAALAALATTMTSRFVFPNGSVDLDEVSYQAQANTLAAGHLTLPTAAYDPYFRPFLTGVRGDRVVFKYQPEWPAMIAASDRAFGTSLPLRAVLGGCGVLAVAWLAWEVARDRRVAIVAAAFTLASPFTWVEAASLLGYQLFFVLAAAAAAALVRAINTRQWGTGVVAGLLVGCAVLHRPFDAALVLGPVLIYTAWRVWRQRGTGRLALGLATGAVGPLVVLGGYNAAVMGAPWRLPFGVTGSIDTIGFGWRASFQVPGGRTGELHYTIGTAFHTLGHIFLVLPLFVAFTPAVVVCAWVLLWMRRRDSRLWLLVAMIATIIVGYFFWWSPANASHFGVDKALGPFYQYPLLAPLLVAGAWGAVILWPRRSALAGLVLVGLAWSVPVSIAVIHNADSQGRVRSAQVATTDAPGSRLVLEPPEFPNDPYVEFANDVPLGNGKRLVAVDYAGRRLDVIDRFPGRPAYLLHVYESLREDRVRLVVTHAPVLRVHLHALVPDGRLGTAYLRLGDGQAQTGSSGSGSIDESWTLGSSMVAAGRNSTVVAVGVALHPPGGSAPSSVTGEWYECRFEARTTSDGAIEALTPCDGWHHYPLRGGATATARVDLSGLMGVTVSPAR